MKLVNAQIQSKKELAQRLLDGEVLHLNGEAVFFDEDEDNPWRVGRFPIASDWADYEQATRKPHWYENITKPVPCRVWGDNRPGELLRWVEARVGGRFQDTDGDNYQHAEPLTAEDIL